MAAPTLIAYAENEAAVASGVNLTTASVSWQTGDVVVVLVASEGGTSGEALQTPTTTGAGISFGAAQKIHSSTGSDCGGAAWAAVATANSSGTFSASYIFAGATRHLLVGVYIARGSAGIGNSVLYTGTAPTGASLTPTAADGMICWVIGDWSTSTVQSMSPTPTTHGTSTPGPSASPVSAQVPPPYTYYMGNLDDQTSAGATSYGITGAGTGPFTIVAIEIKASAGGTDATVIPPARVDVLLS